MVQAQLRADETNSAVEVRFKNYTTEVEPNQPRFTKEQVEFHLKEALKANLALNLAQKNNLQITLSSDDDVDDEDELNELSQSILRPSRSIKREKSPVK